MTVVRGISVSELEPAGIVRLIWRAVGLYHRNFGVLAGLGLLFAALPGCILLVCGINPYVNPDYLDLAIITASALILNCFLTVAVLIVCLLHFIDLRARFEYVLGQLTGHLILKMIGTTFLKSILTVLLSLALIIPGIIFAVRWFLCASAIVTEGVYYSDALRRSSRLVRGQWGRLFRLILVITVVYVLSYGVFYVMSVLGFSEVYSSVISIVVTSLVSPVEPILGFLFYVDARVRKEGLTLELLQESIDLRGSLAGWKF